MSLTPRQQHWRDAAEKTADRAPVAAGLFALLALPNDQERSGHSCTEHSVGFSRNGRRGFKCGVCGEVVKWIDEPEGS